MKVLKVIAISGLIIMSFFSCDHSSEHEPEFIVYNLGLNFQDASDNDLVKGIELEEWAYPNNVAMEDAPWGTVKRDLYVLDIIVAIPCKHWNNETYNTPDRPGVTYDVNRPMLGMKMSNNRSCYLTNNFRLPVGDCPEEKILTYKLKCPYLFGDEAIHEFVTYWDVPKGKTDNQHFAKCYRIEFEGNEVTPVSLDKYELANAANIILDCSLLPH